jgi:hypothetical protein
MKTIKIIMAVVLSVVSVWALAACGGKSGPEIFGSEIDKTKYTKATADGILTSPTDEFYDMDVYIDAVITKICPAGCWFYVKDFGSDSSVELYVDKFKERFLVPSGYEGKRITLYGHVEANAKQNILVAHRMEVLE